MPSNRRLAVFRWLRAGARRAGRSAAVFEHRRAGVLRSISDALRIVPFTTTGWGELSERDLVGIAPAAPNRTRPVCFASTADVEDSLERFGILPHVRSRGYENPRVTLECDHPLGQTVRILGSANVEEPLVEIRLDRSGRVVPGMEVLVLEWILLQDPSRRFKPDRPPLPGQQHPGLGLFRQSFEWLLALCESLGVDGLYLRPSHYHVAAKVRSLGRFLDAEAEGVFRAMEAALATANLVEASWTLARGRLIDPSTDTAVVWDPAAMVLPVSPRLRDVLGGATYENQVAAVMTDRSFLVAAGESPS